MDEIIPRICKLTLIKGSYIQLIIKKDMYKTKCSIQFENKDICETPGPCPIRKAEPYIFSR